MNYNMTRSDVVQMICDAYQKGKLEQWVFTEMISALNTYKFISALKISMHNYVQIYVELVDFEIFKQWRVW